MLYLAAVVCALFGVFAWPLLIVALVLAALGAIVANGRQARPSLFAQIAGPMPMRGRIVGVVVILGLLAVSLLLPLVR